MGRSRKRRRRANRDDRRAGWARPTADWSKWSTEDNDGDERKSTFELTIGRIHADLTSALTSPMRCRCSRTSGSAVHGRHPHRQTASMLRRARGTSSSDDDSGRSGDVLKPIRYGDDLEQSRADANGHRFLRALPRRGSEAHIPQLYQWILDRVNQSASRIRAKRTRRTGGSSARRTPIDCELRSTACRGYIATSRTAKHRVFIFCSTGTVPGHKIDCGRRPTMHFHLGVLSSRIHVTWALAPGAALDRKRSDVQQCRLLRSIPVSRDCTDAQKSRIRALGESLDAHRKRQQALHPGLTITDMYNVLEKLRKNEELTAKDRLDPRAGPGVGAAADPRRPGRGGRRRLRLAGRSRTRKSSAGWSR